MENIKSYRDYYIKNYMYKINNKIETINKIQKMKKGELESMEQWQKGRLAEDLTNKQAKMLYNNELAPLKKLLKKYIVKVKEQQKEEKAKAVASYEDIKALKGIKKAVFEIEWTKTAGAYGYQCKCTSQIHYKNNTYNYYEGEKTGGCGYDKISSALSYNLNHTAKILLVNYGTKILKDSNKHFNCYACENMYFSYGVGLSSYVSMFQYFGYKVQQITHPNEDITLIIEK